MTMKYNLVLSRDGNEQPVNRVLGWTVTDFSNRVVGGKKEKIDKSIYFWNAKKKK